MRARVVAAAILVLGGCTLSRESITFAPSDLNADPKVFDGKEVTVRGWMELGEFRRPNLYDNRDALLNEEINDCIAVSGVELARVADFDKRMVQVTGSFHLELDEPDRMSPGGCHFSGIRVVGADDVRVVR